MPLKNVALILTLTFSAIYAYTQKPSPSAFDIEWKKIDVLISKNGQTKTALKEVNALYARAKKEKNQVHMIKSLLYRMTLNEQLSEDSDTENISSLEKEIKDARQPSKSFLYSLAAGYYWKYLQQNRHKLYGRTTVSESGNNEAATMDIDALHRKITSNYLASINEEELLKKTGLQPFDALIIKGNARKLRPTLFDLLAHRALDYFKNDESDIIRPAYAFEITDSIVFSDAANFALHALKNNDSLSHHFRALQLFKNLTAFHLKDKDPEALLDLDIERLQFANQYAVLEDKNERYESALEKIITSNADSNTTYALYLLSNLHVAKAQKYDPLRDTVYRYEYIKAKEYCNRAIKVADSSEGVTNCKNLLNEILAKHVSIKGETVTAPLKPFRILLSYRNFNAAYFRIVKADKRVKDRIGSDNGDEKMWQQALQLPVLASKEYQLPETNDFQQHRVELAFQELPVGEYALIASTGKDFNVKTNSLALQYFYVSDIGYVTNGNEYFVLNRTTGAPLPGAKVKVYQTSYSGQDKWYKRKVTATYVTDKNGFFTLRDTSDKSGSRIYFLEIEHDKDRLSLDRQVYSYSYSENSEQQKEENIYFFTDRAVYRPGQLVYFKGIGIGRDGKNNHSIIRNKTSVIKLYDANGTDVDSVSLTTNDFGSFSGSFKLPSNLLNGTFTIKENKTKDQINFSVEEYKRPKFIVEIDKPAGTYRVNDSIRITGNAKSYAGNMLDGASVNYRVVRKAIMPYYSDYTSRIWPPYRQEQMEITHGSAITDNDGNFMFSFKAIPDKSLPAFTDPVFNYEVSADVTDVNGETRSSQNNITVGYHSLKLDLNIPSKMRTDSFRVVNISSSNMNDVFEKTKVDISIYQLKTPSGILRERLWEQPDQFIMSLDEYKKLFPIDQFKDELEMNTWPREKTVISRSFLTAPDSSFKLTSKITEPGWYQITVTTKDKFNDSISVTRYINLYNNKINSPLASAIIDADRTEAQPGDDINYSLRTNLDSIYLLHELQKETGIEKTVQMPDQSKNTVHLNIKEADRGMIAVNMVFVKNNRVYSENYNASVPYLNKQLKIDYLTFRDKTVPGTNEKWKVKITGNHAEKVTAELLLGMYDASLDQFMPHSWTIPSIWATSVSNRTWQGNDNFSVDESQEHVLQSPYESGRVKQYDRLLEPDGQIMATKGIMLREVAFNRSEIVYDQNKAIPPKSMVKKEENGSNDQKELKKNESGLPQVVTARKNLNETAFFFPAIYTDTAGNMEFSFTTPEALTKWKLMTLAHTKELAFGYSERTMITQKQLMVQPNPPRFLRQGDTIELSAKVVNMSGKLISANAMLELTDAATGKSINHVFKNNSSAKNFSIAAGQSAPVFFSITVPDTFNDPVLWRITASTNTTDSSTNRPIIVSDGEEAILPVISNRIMVTETMPMPIKVNTERTFNFSKLLNSGGSNTLKQSGLTIEFTSNPAWYAVQSLPYLAEGEKENSEAIFNRFYANALASKIAGSSPRFHEIVEKWKSTDTAAMISNLQKNEELKSVLLQETPWVLEAKNETQQKKNLSLLFEFFTLSGNLESSLSSLADMQSPEGGFVWYKGGPQDRYMTTYIITGIGKLKKLGAVSEAMSVKLNEIARRGISYLDQQLKNDYKQVKNKKQKSVIDQIDYSAIQYLYMRSLFTEPGVPGDVFPAYNYYRNVSKSSWIKQSSYLRAMIALALYRTGDIQNANKIMTALKESSINSEELGMYWKDMSGGYYWYQAPVEAQAVLIEAFNEILKDTSSVNDLKTWLLKNKQTNSWRTSRATADACYALLLQGSDWLHAQPAITIQLGDTTITSSAQKQEAGTGYFKTRIEGNNIKPAMGKILVNIKDSGVNPQPAWGAAYWQYFDDLNKITSAATPLQLKKQLFIEKNTDRGPVLQPLKQGNTIHVGDKVKVRIELRSDRTMEYVHMKDMRAACFEPVDVLSTYKYQDGLGYYESVKDVSANFYFNVLPKGIYVFEYTLTVTHSGTFSNGITSIQCMYAPEFTSHSEGITVKAERQQ